MRESEREKDPAEERKKKVKNKKWRKRNERKIGTGGWEKRKREKGSKTSKMIGDRVKGEILTV